MTILKLLEASTAHVQKDDNDILSQGIDQFGLVVLNREYGWMMLVPGSADAWKEHREAVKNNGLSKAVTDVLRYAHKKGCAWVYLDRDEEPVPGLKTYSW